MKSLPKFLDAIPQQPLLGYRVDEQGQRYLVTYPGDKGLITVAPNRSGKMVSVLGPNAICHRWSFAGTDPKGELTKLFARWRCEVLGQPTFIYDPIHAVEDDDIPVQPYMFSGAMSVDSDGVIKPRGTPRLRAGFNPIEMIRRSAHPVAVAKMIATAAIPIQGTNPFWSESAQGFFAAYMCFVALDEQYDQPRTMRSVWNDLTLTSPSVFEAMLTIMAESPIQFVAGGAREFLDARADTVKDIRKTIKTQGGRILDDPQILESLSYTSLDFGRLQREAVTVFFVLPGWAGEQYANFFRVMLSCLFMQIEQVGLPPGGQKRGKTIIALDEFPSLRRSETIKESLPRLPGYSVQFWPFVQDLNQLASIYEKGWETFISNAGVIQTFGGSSDNFTAEYLSNMAGTYTAPIESVSQPNVGARGSVTHSHAKRPGLMPYEIATLNAKPGDELRQVLFFSGKGYTFADRLLFYKDFPDFMAFYEKTPAGIRDLEEAQA